MALAHINELLSSIHLDDTIVLEFLIIGKSVIPTRLVNRIA